MMSAFRPSSGLNLDDFPPVVVTAGVAKVMRLLELPAIGTLLKGGGDQRMMTAAHIAT